MSNFEADYKDDMILRLVQFIAGAKFQNAFEKFFLAHAKKFQDNEEHQLVYTDVYNEFQALFDSFMEEFLQKEEMTTGEFMKRCRKAQGDDAKAAHYLDVVFASTDYVSFVRLMRLMKPLAERKATAASMGAESKGGSKGGDDDDDDVKGGGGAKSSGGGGGGGAKASAGSKGMDDDDDDDVKGGSYK